MDEGPVSPVDGRAQRLAQATTTVLVLTGFVFTFPWLVGVVAVVHVVGAALGPDRQPFLLGYTKLYESRFPARDERDDEDRDAVHAQDVLLAALLVLSVIALVVGVGVLGWLFAITAAVVAAIAATTGLLLAVSLRERLHRD